MAKIELEVVDVEGELLFKTKPPQKEVLFDVLDAFSFEGGILSVSRNGQEIARTEAIEEYGTHAATTCFIGLETFAGPFKVANAIISEDFQNGDLLNLEAPSLAEDFDLGGELYKHSLLNKALEQMPLGQQMPVREFFDKLGEHLSVETDLTPPTIIRLMHHE